MIVGASHIEKIKPYEYKQYRRHNRAFCDAQRDRLYRQDGKIVARNRHKKTEQEEPSLEEYRQEIAEVAGKREASRAVSRLKVCRAVKRMRTPAKELLITSGSSILYKGQRFIVKGILHRGKSLLLEGCGDYVPASSCKLLTRNGGIVCI